MWGYVHKCGIAESGYANVQIYEIMQKWLSQFIFSPHSQQLGIIRLIYLCQSKWKSVLKLSCGFNLHSSDSLLA